MEMTAIDILIESLPGAILVPEEMPDDLKISADAMMALMLDVRDDIAGNIAMRNGSALEAALTATR